MEDNARSGTPLYAKARLQQGALKVIHTIFSIAQELLVSWPVLVGTTVNAAYMYYHKCFLQEKMRPAIRRKRPELPERGFIFHYDNAPVHTPRLVTDCSKSWDSETLEYPRYLRYLAPADFFIFPIVKDPLRGRRFESQEESIDATTTSQTSGRKGFPYGF